MGIDLLTLPTHITHNLQPFNLSMFCPFKSYFKSKRELWMANPRIEVKRFELVKLPSRDFKRALTILDIKDGFR